VIRGEGIQYWDPAYDKLWQAAVDNNLPVSLHAATSRDPEKTWEVKSAALSVLQTVEIEHVILEMIFAGVFDRFPTMRYYFAETQIGWLPYCLSQLDETYEQHRDYAYSKWGLEPLARLPSEYLRERCLWGFIKDPFGVQLRHTIGIDNIIWGSDFAHGQGYWPHSQKAIDESMVGVPQDERRSMLVGNVVKYFRLDDA